MMWQRRLLFLVTTLTASIYTSYGCQMEGVSSWFVPVLTEVIDIQRGSFFSRTTTNINGISSFSHGEGLRAGPYVDVDHDGSSFTISTNAAFPNYETNEISSTMSVTVVFACSTGPSTATLVFLINVIDTNNNAPGFIPTDQFEFILTPPLPPGFQITGCLDDITVRDIDLTTQRIEFAIDDNPYFEIDFDSALTVPDSKEFKAVLRTKTLIRTIPDVIELSISATDVDLTDDPPLTTYATLRIQGDSEFELPAEPIFSQAYYLAEYTTSHEVILQEPISLRQGFDDSVIYSLEGEHVGNFALAPNGNQLTLTVTTPLSDETLRTGQIFLIVRAEREFTSGATTTVVIQLPEILDLEFEHASYEGTIIDNILEPLQLTLSQGYQDDVSVTISSEHASFFTSTVQENVITLTMAPLDESIINENNFINLQVVASTDHSAATTVVTLDIVKDDNVTPAFGSAIYIGSYDSQTGLSHEQITLAQGYDNTVEFALEGEHASHFQLDHVGPVLTLTSTTLPPEILGEQHLLLTVLASKPRTVGANAAISISLPPARVLSFEESTYSGTLQDNTLSLQTIVLNVGYAEDVAFTLTGDFANSFSISYTQNQVTLSLLSSLPESVILENSFIMLTLSATGQHAIATSTNVLLEILKQDVTTPVFSQRIYSGIYSETTDIEFDTISLLQGFDSSVSFRLDGEHAQYFSVHNVGNNVVISLESPIPEQLIFNDKVVLFSVVADKPLTVGGDAAIAITFPPELTDRMAMRFSQNTYIGSIEDDFLTLNNIVLETGFAPGTEFILTGEFSSLFEINTLENVVTISILNSLSDEIKNNNEFIVLELEAERDRAVSVTTSIIIGIVKQDIVHPIFAETYYRGVYTAEIGLQFDDEISLVQGYDETVAFELEGEHAAWFVISVNGNSVGLSVDSEIPGEVVLINNQLLFTIVANKPGSFGARAAISIDLPKETPEAIILRFTQSSYVGSIENGELIAPALTLLGTYTDLLQLDVSGEYSDHFTLSRDSTNVVINMVSDLPPEVIEENTFIILDIEASYPDAITGFTSLVIEIIKEPQTATPVFEQAYYIGEYSELNGFLFEHTIQLIEGFDETVSFTLAGDDAEWFELIENGVNSLSLRIREDGTLQIADRSHLVFSIVANKPNSFGGRTAVVISLSDFSTTRPLRFSQNYYTGTIESGIFTVDTINLEEGYTVDIAILFTGDYRDYFQLTNEEGIFTLQLVSDLPAEITDANNVLIFTLEVQLESTRAHTTIIIELIKDQIGMLAFDEPYYIGSYSETNGFVFDKQINLIGYDESVQFSLEGENALWFEVERIGDAVSIITVSPIPPEVIYNYQHLTFTITAQNLNSITTRAAIIVTLIDDRTVLSFERSSYVGSIENNIASIEPIILHDGYSMEISFDLFGELSTHFRLLQDGPTVNIILESDIPESLIPENNIILLELQASAPQSLSDLATIIFTLVDEDTRLIELIFSEPFYTGHYTQAAGLIFYENIMLIDGYDETVEFALEGEHSQWFDITVSGNLVSLTLNGPIPPAVITNNHQLIFVIIAQRLGGTTARATIVLSLTDEFADGSLLGFERISYLGTIEDNVANLEPITLIEGYSEEVSFTLHGVLAPHFSLTQADATVTIALQNTISEDELSSNGIIVLELEASAPQIPSAFATVVFEIVRDDTNIVELVFTEPFYTGHYTQAAGLIFHENIMLIDGYDETVEFALEGEHSQWFDITVSGNLVSLTLNGPIPPAVITNNHQLIFVIIAQRLGGTTARATIVLSLTDEFTDGLLLGFERISYLGTIEDNVANVEPITLNEGYSEEVSFTLHGVLAPHFSLTQADATVTIALQSAISEDELSSNGIIVLELEASAPQIPSAFATVVFEIVHDDTNIVELVFSEPFYTGHYTQEAGLIFHENIMLIDGYDETVEFALEGEHSQWFDITVSGNLVSLTLNGPIPPAVITNNHQLIFVIIAQRLGGTTARATIVLSLTDEFTDGLLLGFERISYLGTIEDNVANVEPITLNEGYSEEVSFTLHGVLAPHFSLTQADATVTIALQSAISEDELSSNGIIVLELEASAPQIPSAFATVVFEIVHDDTNIVELVFSEPFYTGHYTQEAGLIFHENIMLIDGYDETVEFALEGEHSQWFDITVSGNLVSLTLNGPIPPAVITNNHQLIFVIIAQRLGGTTARATIVLSLTDEFTDGLLLGFKRISYLGTIEDNVANVEPITLNEGYSEEVSFTLHGVLAPHFSLTQADATVTIALQNAISEDELSSNRIIVLELEASAPQKPSAFATVVFEIVRDDTNIVELVFTEPFYTGHYTQAAGLIFHENIMLIDGYDETVEFALEGEHSQWFDITVSGNLVSLTLNGPIPPAVITNNHQLIFVIIAQRLGGTTARATIVLSLTDEFTDGLLLGFERISYLGTIEDNVANVEPITLNEGYSEEVSFTLHGVLAPHFSLTQAGATVTIALQSAISEDELSSNGIIVLELEASAPQIPSTFATVVFEIVHDDTNIVELVFSEPFYTGHYTQEAGLIFHENIMLIDGYDETVEFALEGEHSQWFDITVSGNLVSLTLNGPIPPAVITNNHQLIFVIIAQRLGGTTARATIVLSLTDEFTDGLLLGFERISYLGTIEDNVANVEPITLNEGYSEEVSFTLHGVFAPHFSLTQADATVTIALQSAISEDELSSNGIIVLELEASAPQILSAFATVVFEIVRDDTNIVELVFSEPFYTGHYTQAAGLIFHENIILIDGYDKTVEFALEGEHSQWFDITVSGNLVSLTLNGPIPPAVITNNHQLIFVIIAQRLGGTMARATIVLSLTDEFTDGLLLGFERISYLGTIEDNVANVDPITLNEGYSEEVSFTLHGALSYLFSFTVDDATVTILLQSAIPEESIPSNGIIVLELGAHAPYLVSAFATVVFGIAQEYPSNIEFTFSEAYYIGHYNEAEGLLFENTITLTQVYDESIVFTLEGADSQWFGLIIAEDSITVILLAPIPQDVLESNRKLVFVIVSYMPGSIPNGRSAIIISLPIDSQINPVAIFEKVLFKGILQAGVVRHELITVIGYYGTDIELLGEYSDLFIAHAVAGEVDVRGVGSVTLADDVSFVALELRADDASAVLILDVISTAEELPTVTFSSASYSIRVDVSHTGLVGRVEATSDNSEDVTYSLELDDDHLLERLSIDNEGGLHLSAPANIGIVIFQVVATSVFTRVTGAAQVHLTVDAITVCGEDDELFMPPLLILERDEEVPHENLVPLSEKFEGCQYRLTNSWPTDQTWLYTDENGLHTHVIDREDESIAFMALSQVQVELILECDRDNKLTRSKRSLNTRARLDWLGPYDYGDNKWILSDTILYNSRRTLVNLIVNDINDNDPIFDGEQNQPVIVGYPVPELEERVLPRALIELKATDKDVGENAALRYWSSEEILAVSPTTGVVHVRLNTQLEDDTSLTVHATDRNGVDGRTGSLELLVKLLDINHIAVVTVRNAFLENEESILADLTAAVGYDIKVLRSTVISADDSDESDTDDEPETEDEPELDSRKKRELNPVGASMQLYVYGLIGREPVEVDRLTVDINNNAGATVSIASTISLEDHLDSLDVCPGRDTGLLVATIVLSVLLFIVIVVAAVWFFLRWRKNRKLNYDQFEDTNSLASQNEAPPPLKLEPSVKPRLNIEELRKSEKKLQERLQSPIEEVTVEPSTSTRKQPDESVVNMSILNSQMPQLPIVIQSIEKIKDGGGESDEDEFGEIKKPRRKSVVTFNENVEKIIHVEDDPDDGSLSDTEIYKL